MNFLNWTGDCTRHGVRVAIKFKHLMRALGGPHEYRGAPKDPSVSLSFRGLSLEPNHEGESRAYQEELVSRCCSDSRSISKLLGTNVSKASLLASFSLFSARNEPSWLSPNLDFDLRDFFAELT